MTYTAAEYQRGAHLEAQGRAKEIARPPASESVVRGTAQLQKSDAARRNKTEAAFRRLQLIRKREGEIHDCLWEPFNLRLADNTYYKPDCLVIGLDGTMTLYEVKGYWRDDARVKTKVAARQHYYFRFVAVQRRKGEWQYEDLSASTISKD